MENKVIKKKSGIHQKRLRENIFYACAVALPLLNFLIFFIGVNFNTINPLFVQDLTARFTSEGGFRVSITKKCAIGRNCSYMNFVRDLLINPISYFGTCGTNRETVPWENVSVIHAVKRMENGLVNAMER